MSRCGFTGAGFTLIEILVSLMIFSIVSLAMFGILMASTNIFRSAEFGRASTDEAVSALSILDADIRRMVPGGDGGLFYSILHDPVTAQQPAFPVNGDCATAFIAYQTDIGQVQGQSGSVSAQSTVQHGGSGARQLVIYFVEYPSSANGQASSDTMPNEEILWRLQEPILEDIPTGLFPPPTQFPQPYQPPTNDVELIEQLLCPAQRAIWLSENYMAAPSAVARRVLHFGTWISNDQQQRAASGDWLVDTSATPNPIPPFNPTTAGSAVTLAYTTLADPTAGSPSLAAPTSASAMNSTSFPTAVLFTLSLSVGRYAPQGTVMTDLGGSPEQIRISNLPSLPMTQGAKVRVGTEWIEYSSYSGGMLSVMQPGQDPLLPLGGRGALRSTVQSSILHGMPVQWGPMYSLARTFPH